MPDFKSTTRDVRKILDDFNAKGVDAVVLDLRRNGGGSLNEAISLTGLFIDDGPVVQVKDADGRVQPYHDVEPGIGLDGPAGGADQQVQRQRQRDPRRRHPGLRPRPDRRRPLDPRQGHRAKPAGPGPAVVPRCPTPKLGALKITMQQFYRPNGDSTQKRGVLADIELPSLTTHLDVGEADLDYPVTFDQVEPPSLSSKFGYVDQDHRGPTATASPTSGGRPRTSSRRSSRTSPATRSRRTRSRHAQRGEVPEERAELNADKEEEKEIEEMNDPSQPGIKLDYYLKEVLAIAADYLQPGLVAWNAK